MNNSPFWIAIGDIHEDIANIGRIPEIEKAQGVIISGDITTRGQRSVAEQVLAAIESYNGNILAQIGNMDSREVASLLDEKGYNVHARAVDMDHGVGLIGLGYSTPTPFNTPSEVSEERLAGWLDKLRQETGRFKHLLFLVHTPPFETKADRLANGTSVGSPAVRAFIETQQPEVCITGHIHESQAIDQLGRTQIINPGMFGSGGYARIQLDKDRLSAELLTVA